MSAYFIARVKISDKEKYKQYIDAVPSVIDKFNGKAIVRTEQCLTLEGTEENRRIIIIEFPSLEKAKEFYYSEEYQKIKEIRKKAAIGEIIVVESLL
ncbi:MAG: DUF1330 domain-containing protein [Bacteroidales bacterium]|nr:DUF1330 domain-containing protein [Bacteroidales bacterium]